MSNTLHLGRVATLPRPHLAEPRPLSAVLDEWFEQVEDEQERPAS